MKYFEGIHSVFEEAARFSGMTWEELKKQSSEDLLSTLPSPDARGTRICGTKAKQTLRTIAELAIQRSDYKGRIALKEVTKHLEEGIIDRFIVQKQDFNARNVDRAVAAAVKRTARDIRSITHFIPCLIYGDDEPKYFEIGSVQFEQRAACFERLKPAFEQYQQDTIQKEGKPDALLAPSLAYFDGFNWIAQVTIVDCDPPTSRARAEQIVRTTLDFLHVMLGTKLSSRLRVGGPNMLVDIRGGFEITDGKICHVVYSRAMQSDHLGENWLAQLNSSQAAALFPIIAKTITEGLHPSSPAPLAQRLIDAARWYGDAAREKFPASQLVKFVVAIERVLTTKKEKDITKTFCNRGSALICHPHRERIPGVHKSFSKVYAARSQFVHGSKSPFDSKFGAALVDAEELSRSVIWSAMFFLDQGGRLYERGMTDKHLDVGFERLVEWANA